MDYEYFLKLFIKQGMEREKTGGSCRITTKQIKEFSALPIKTRLQLLEDANKFLWEAMDEKAKKARELFRKGEI